MENTVGSLTEEQKFILIGKLLGDGSLRRKSNTLLEINHSSKQGEYVFWLYDKFRNLVKTGPKIRVSGHKRLSYRFTTLSFSSLNVFYDMFYSKGYKSIPDYLDINELSLAVWYMDDGSKNYLNTQQFDLVDQRKLIYVLDSFGIKATLNRDKIYHRIRIYDRSMSKFKALIEPYLIPGMRYKLP